MISARLHLDPADESNGALRVLPGTHRHGRLTGEQIEKFRATIPEVLCRAAPGDALLMRPLLLHASSRATAATRRRVLHIEYAACDLPSGVSWHPSA
jgi:ectoine hydroxylase-related dioxygenase (phytanoyl-CoA dioxygenase family)